jgi:hypothetical protein
MKIVTIHQPNYLPWIGLFSKIKKSNQFVIADTFTIGDQSTVNRNKIRTNTGWMYLTIPLNHNIRGMRICDIPLPSDKSWQRNHWRSIYANYSRTAYFNDYKFFFENLYLKNFKYICEINLEIIDYLLKCFHIEVDMKRASNMDIDQSLAATDLIVEVLSKTRGDIYLSGPSGRDYMIFEKFTEHNIGLKFIKFIHPEYNQRYPGFVPNMSAIDLLFNTGPQAGTLIENAGNLEY